MNARPRVLRYSSIPAVLLLSRSGIFRLTCQLVSLGLLPLITGTSITPLLCRNAEMAHFLARRDRSNVHRGTSAWCRTPFTHSLFLNEGRVFQSSAEPSAHTGLIAHASMTLLWTLYSGCSTFWFCPVPSSMVRTARVIRAPTGTPCPIRSK